MTLQTKPSLTEAVAAAVASYKAMTPDQKARHDHEQRRSFVRGMCPDNRDYDEWCKVVDSVMPPLSAPTGWPDCDNR